MEIGVLAVLIMGIACPLMMGGMMWMMVKDRRSAKPETPLNAADRLAALQKQRQQLETEIAELKQIVQLEAQQQALDSGSVAGEKSSVSF